MEIKSSSKYKRVNSDYTFSFQNTEALPANGRIQLKFPTEWLSEMNGGADFMKFDDLSGSWTLAALNYELILNLNDPNDPYNFIIITKFEWPSKTQLKIKIKNFANPDEDETKIFGARTKYDGEILDRTDYSDKTLKLFFESKPASF